MVAGKRSTRGVERGATVEAFRGALHAGPLLGVSGKEDSNRNLLLTGSRDGGNFPLRTPRLNI